MKRKLYAVKYRNGRSKIYAGTWDEVRKDIDGKKGVAYKGFAITDHHEAEEWLARKAVPYRTKKTPHEKNKVYLYVDGSFSGKLQRAGWGWVAVQDGRVIGEDYGSLPNTSGSRNIIGEVNAATQALIWAVNNKLKEVILVHDYFGISMWALGYWKPRKPVAVEYKNRYDELSPYIDVHFEKVNGHCGIKWNDYADELTRRYMGDRGDER